MCYVYINRRSMLRSCHDPSVLQYAGEQSRHEKYTGRSETQFDGWVHYSPGIETCVVDYKTAQWLSNKEALYNESDAKKSGYENIEGDSIESPSYIAAVPFSTGCRINNWLCL